MQPDVVIAAAQPVERIQPADCRMPLEDRNALSKVSTANPRS